MALQKYALIHRLLHWLIALGIIGLVTLGLYMSGLESGHPDRLELYMLHKSLGVTVLGLAVLRLISRALTYIPAMPNGLMGVEKLLAKTVHALLYVAMFAMPVSGIVMSNAAGYEVKWFGYALPRVTEKAAKLGEFAHESHELGGYILIALISLHVLGALKHRFIDRNKDNDVLSRML